MHNSNSRSKANPSGLESLNGQEETRTEEKHMNSTGTNGEGGFEEAVEAKDWRFDAFVSSDELITCGDQEGMGARSGEGGLGMESQERNIVTADVIPLAALPHLRGKAEPQVREIVFYAMNEVWEYSDYFFPFLFFPRLVIPLKLPQTTQATDLEEIIIENVEVQHQVAESRRKRSKSNGVAKDESILRNERAKKLLLEQKKIADVCLFSVLFSYFHNVRCPAYFPCEWLF